MNPETSDTSDEWSEEEMLKAYRDAAEHDRYMFGDFDYEKIWLDNDNAEEL